MVSDALMYDTYQVRALAVELEGESAFGVSLGAPGFFHSLAKFQQDNLVAGRRLVRSAVSDSSGEVLGVGERCGGE